ncbi:MAG: DUF4446 family protein [Solirubrobacterales bacterium]
MGALTTTTGLVALGAALLAALALICCAALAARLRRVRADQALVLGEGGDRDLVAQAAGLEREIGEISSRLDSQIERLDGVDGRLREGLDGAVTHCAVVRYDALGEMGGRQSSSVALLDARRNGVVLSSILHREQARLYAKQIVAGRPEMELSPEEEEAMRSALGGGGRGRS